jgi:hypothetical protein
MIGFSELTALTPPTPFYFGPFRPAINTDREKGVAEKKGSGVFSNLAQVICAIVAIRC